MTMDAIRVCELVIGSKQLTTSTNQCVMQVRLFRLFLWKFVGKQGYGVVDELGLEIQMKQG